MESGQLTDGWATEDEGDRVPTFIDGYEETLHRAKHETRYAPFRVSNIRLNTNTGSSLNNQLDLWPNGTGWEHI
jgi:hypothetical protein